MVEVYRLSFLYTILKNSQYESIYGFIINLISNFVVDKENESLKMFIYMSSEEEVFKFYMLFSSICSKNITQNKKIFEIVSLDVYNRLNNKFTWSKKFSIEVIMFYVADLLAENSLWIFESELFVRIMCLASSEEKVNFIRKIVVPVKDCIIYGYNFPYRAMDLVIYGILNEHYSQEFFGFVFNVAQSVKNKFRRLDVMVDISMWSYHNKDMKNFSSLCNDVAADIDEEVCAQDQLLILS